MDNGRHVQRPVQPGLAVRSATVGFTDVNALYRATCGVFYNEEFYRVDNLFSVIDMARISDGSRAGFCPSGHHA